MRSAILLTLILAACDAPTPSVEEPQAMRRDRQRIEFCLNDLATARYAANGLSYTPADVTLTRAVCESLKEDFRASWGRPWHRM